MSKERLEESKNVIEDIEDLQNERDFRQADIAKCYLVEKHGRWLIEQAERAQELEDRIKDDEHYVAEILEQNKRYRTLLKEVNLVIREAIDSLNKGEKEVGS